MPHIFKSVYKVKKREKFRTTFYQQNHTYAYNIRYEKKSIEFKDHARYDPYSVEIIHFPCDKQQQTIEVYCMP